MPIRNVPYPEFITDNEFNLLTRTFEVSVLGTTYTKKKQIRNKRSATYNIVFDLKTSNVSYYAYGRIYKNGVAYGTVRSTLSDSYVSFSEQLFFQSGDTIELWICAQTAGTYAYNNNLQIRGLPDFWTKL